MFFGEKTYSTFVYLLMMQILGSILSSEILLGINSAKCGQRPFSGRYKIVGGQTSRLGDWGWQVTLYQII